MPTRNAFTSLLLLACASQLPAQQHPHVTPGKLGAVHFSISCKPAVAADFDRGVALLHSFEFGESIRGFEKVLAADSTCAMAHWGIALSRWGNPMAAGNRSAAQLAAGSKSVAAARSVGASATAREREYIEAVARLYDNSDGSSQSDRVVEYAKAMEVLAAKHPADTEAAIFHAISLVATASPADKTYRKQKQAGAILEALWTKQPDHPGLAHYIIHTFDYPALASKASRAADRYAAIAPSAAHARHMPSHIFTRLGSWRESIATNRQSMEIAERAGSIAEVLHAADYAVYAYLQIGNDSAALRVVNLLPSLAERFDVNAVTGAAPGSAGVFALAAIPARYALERSAWSEAAALQAKPSGFPWTEAMTWFARSIGASHMRDFTKAQSSVDSLVVIRDRLVAKGESYWSDQVAIQVLGARAWLELYQGRVDSAESLLRDAAAREDETEKNVVTPGPLAPAREMLGDMLVERRRYREALAEYRKVLKSEPGRRRALAGIRAALAGS